MARTRDTTPSVSGLPVRYHAYQAVMGWQHKKFSFIQDYYDRRTVTLSANDLALSREIALGVVRYKSLYETLIQKFLKGKKIKGKKQSEELLLILCIAAHQIFVLERVPDHAIGQCSVALADNIQRSYLKPVVNAVMHKLITLRDVDAEIPRIAAKHLPHDMARAYSFSAVFVSDMQRAYKKTWRQILTQLNAIPPICLRRSPDAAAYTSEYIMKESGDWTWWDNPQAALAVVKNDQARVQDFSQSHVMRLANIQQGERVLDVCAAPGGKSVAAYEHTQHVFSADIQIKKVRAMSVGGHRLVQDACQPAVRAATFDVVLADVPCSNSGVFARRPEARWRYSQAHNDSLIELQHTILDQAAGLVCAGGRLVYSTCSITPSENQDQVARFLASHTGVWDMTEEHSVLPDAWQAGAYVAVLRRCR